MWWFWFHRRRYGPMVNRRAVLLVFSSVKMLSIGRHQPKNGFGLLKAGVTAPPCSGGLRKRGQCAIGSNPPRGLLFFDIFKHISPRSQRDLWPGYLPPRAPAMGGAGTRPQLCNAGKKNPTDTFHLPALSTRRPTEVD